MKEPIFDRDPNPAADHVSLPAIMLPSYRTSVAIHRGVEKRIMLKTWGGLGDQACAEPTLRYALKAFSDCEISLATEQPSLFEHLKFARVFDLKSEQPIWDRYFVFDTIFPAHHVQWEFISHMLVNCVDYPALCAFRCQLPVHDRALEMIAPWSEVPRDIAEQVENMTSYQIAVHPGRHWQSKTFPKDWWDGVLAALKSHGVTPIIIGADADDNRSTVDVDTTGCLDLRNKTTIRQTLALLQHLQGLITNDSSPLHLAASGKAWISFVATVKHEDFISHWRRDRDGRTQWKWRMKNYGLGNMLDLYSQLPNQAEEITCEHVDPGVLASWLPDYNFLVSDTLLQIDEQACPRPPRVN